MSSVLNIAGSNIIMPKNFTSSISEGSLFDLELPMNMVRGGIKVQRIFLR